MFSWASLLSTCLLVNAARLEEERDLFDITSAGVANDSRDVIDFEHSSLSNHENSDFIAMGQETSEETSEEAPQSRRKKRRRGRGKRGKAPNSGGPSGEKISADEMQRGLVEFLKQHRGSGGLPEFHKAPIEYKTLLATARAKARDWQSWEVPPRSCLEQLGGLVNDLVRRCIGVFKTRSTSTKETERNCAGNFQSDGSVYNIFLRGKGVVETQPLPEESVMDFPKTKPLVEAGRFIKTWLAEMATAKKAAILWAGFWTDASDPEGHKSRTSKESLFHFADRIETQTVHPSTDLGQLAEKYDNLAACQGPIENELKGNMWSLFSFAFVYGMREKRQDVVVALVHKEMDGTRPLSESILFQYEVPTIGIAAWGLGQWSPQVVLIDLLGTCKKTSPALRRQLYSGLAEFYEYVVKEFQWSSLDFAFHARVSWTCLDCPHSHCHLDDRLAKQVKELLQAKRQQDQAGAALTRAAKAGDVSRMEELLNDGADVNFQDKEGDTALSFAVQNGHAKAAQFLLDHGAYVDARNSWSRTPLFDAGTRELQKLLLEHGANRKAKTFGKEIPHLKI